MTVSEARARLMRLQIERLDVVELGVDETSSYMARLGAAIADAKSDYIARAVTEIAAMRVDLDAPAQQAQAVALN